jgi:hypothetical protein
MFQKLGRDAEMGGLGSHADDDDIAHTLVVFNHAFLCFN